MYLTRGCTKRVKRYYSLLKANLLKVRLIELFSPKLYLLIAEAIVLTCMLKDRFYRLSKRSTIHR